MDKESRAKVEQEAADRMVGDSSDLVFDKRGEK